MRDYVQSCIEKASGDKRLRNEFAEVSSTAFSKMYALLLHSGMCEVCATQLILRTLVVCGDKLDIGPDDIMVMMAKDLKHYHEELNG